MTQIAQITTANKLVSDFVKENEFDHFSLKFVNSNLMVDLAETHSELVSVFKLAGVAKKPNEKVDITKIIASMPATAKAEDCWIAREFRSVVGTIHEISKPGVEDRIAKGKVKFYEIPFVLKPGMRVITADDNGNGIGGILKSIDIVDTMFGPVLKIGLSIIVSAREGRVETVLTKSFRYFDGILDVSKLPVRFITDEETLALTERGRIFNKYTKDVQISSYKGTIAVPGWFGENLFRADGRAMIDIKTFTQMEPDLYRQMLGEFNFRDVDNSFDDDDDDFVEAIDVSNATETEATESYTTTSKDLDIPEKHLWRCYHRIPGFSMRLKMWGWIEVSNLSPVVWRDDAFENLVLPNKDRIFHLVKNYDSGFSDFIDDKSGGLIFLLHGPTGQGKTLTAEAVAESLRRPLYSISMGELGTTVVAMEKKLRNILDLAHQWNAVLLLDEADIFMEARDATDVERNAMVSIFLRILEYHSGVMFLTTNRVKAFDPAFFSRISMAIEYEAMTETNRQNIWLNLLNAAKIDHSGFDLKVLASHKINGRNMKTAVRLAQTTARGHNREIAQSDIEDVLKTAEAFNSKVGIY
jgi:hypothetical protein